VFSGLSPAEEEQAVADWLRDYQASLASRMQPMFDFAREVLVAVNAVIEALDDFAGAAGEQAKRERLESSFQEVLCFWTHMGTHQVLMNLTRQRKEEALTLLSALIARIGTSIVETENNIRGGRGSREQFIEFLNETEKLYSESRLQFASCGYSGLFIDVSRRIAQVFELDAEWEHIRTPLIQMFESNWTALSFRLTLLRFSID
jgi:hypothetical protein